VEALQSGDVIFIYIKNSASPGSGFTIKVEAIQSGDVISFFLDNDAGIDFRVFVVILKTFPPQSRTKQIADEGNH
jgi:hypothetical protein